MVEACIKSLPYSDRAINIMKVECRDTPVKLRGFLQQGLDSSLKSEKDV